MAHKELSEDDLVNLVCESDKSDEEELGRKLGNHFIQNDKRWKGFTIQKLHKSLLSSIWRSLQRSYKKFEATDFITTSQNVNISAWNIESAQITSSDESEFQPSIPKKRMRVISDSDEG